MGKPRLAKEDLALAYQSPKRHNVPAFLAGRLLLVPLRDSENPFWGTDYSRLLKRSVIVPYAGNFGIPSHGMRISAICSNKSTRACLGIMTRSGLLAVIGECIPHLLGKGFIGEPEFVFFFDALGAGAPRKVVFL